MSSTRLSLRARAALTAVVLTAVCAVATAYATSREFAVDAGGLPRIVIDRGDIIKKLYAHQFDTLNAEMTAYEKKAESDPRYEMQAMVAFGAFSSSQSNIAELTKQWCKAQPHSYAAHLARAEALSSMAATWRGIETIDNTPASHIRQMELYYADAVHEEDLALASDPKLSIAHALKIKAARVAGGDDEAESAQGEALNRVPASFAVREQIIYALRPRWGGARAAMAKFAEEAQEYSAENPSNRFLLAWLPLDQGDDFADNHQWYEAISYYNQALKVGGEYWTTYRRLANAYIEITNYKEALRAALRANQLYPQNSEVLRMLAIASSSDDRPEACVLWSSQYLRFELPDPLIFQIAQQSAQELKAQGKSNW